MAQSKRRRVDGNSADMSSAPVSSGSRPPRSRSQKRDKRPRHDTDVASDLPLIAGPSVVDGNLPAPVVPHASKDNNEADASTAGDALPTPNDLSMTLVSDLSSGEVTSLQLTTGIPLTQSVTAPVNRNEGDRARALLASHADLEERSQKVRMDLVASTQADKQTAATYLRHVKNYLAWWTISEHERVDKDPDCAPIPAEPITPAKAAMFVFYESTRPKRTAGGASQEGTLLGKSAIAQVISALEHHRLNNEHRYDDPQAKISLRDDNRINTIEAAARHNEPQRAQSAQTLKATGTSADTYGEQELSNAALAFLHIHSAPKKLVLALRDRAMLLTSAVTAFRGDSSRGLLWSDLFTKEVPMHAIRRGHKEIALVFYSDNAKTNQNGRTDEFGALRHAQVELCAIGALALHMFGQFHIQCIPVPDFTPDLSDRKFGEYGRRDWYQNHVFYASSITKEMAYDTHRNRVLQLHEQNEISITKVTHAGRNFAAQNSRSHGSSISDTKALGGWQAGKDSFRDCYDRELPVAAMLGAAMFDANSPASYFVARAKLDPPLSLEVAIFPWIDAEDDARKRREQANRLTRDISLAQFLKTMRFLRRVLLQDTAILYVHNPQALIFQYAPFNTQTFRDFATTAPTIVGSAEEKARLALKNLPATLALSFQGAVAGIDIARQEDRKVYDARLDRLEDGMDGIKNLLQAVLDTRSQPPTRTRRRQVSHASSSVSSSSSTSGRSVSSPVPLQAPTPVRTAMLRRAPPPHSPSYASTPESGPLASNLVIETHHPFETSAASATVPTEHDDTGHDMTVSCGSANAVAGPSSMQLSGASHIPTNPVGFSSSLPAPPTPYAAQYAGVSYGFNTAHGFGYTHPSPRFVMTMPTPAYSPVYATEVLPHMHAGPSSNGNHDGAFVSCGGAVTTSGPTASVAPETAATEHVPHTNTLLAGPAMTIEEIKWAALAARYGDDCLRSHPSWVFTDGDWLPVYTPLPVSTISDVWREYNDGMGPNLPVRVLNAGWDAKWKENNRSRITESSRRMSIVKLVEELSARDGWDVPKALKFLCELYEPKYRPRNFSEFLQKKPGTNRQSVLAAADTYVS